MCWNQTVSINTFIIGVAAILLAYINEYKWYFLVFVFSFIVIQLLEALIWTFLDNTKMNMILTIAIFIIIIAQPFASILLLTDKNNGLRNKLWISYGVLIVGALLIILVSNKNIGSQFKTIVSDNGHLSWRFFNLNNIFLIETIYAIFFFGALLFFGNYLILAVATVTLLLSLYYSRVDKTYATMWCWTANIVSLYIIVKIILFNNPWCKV